MYSRSILLLLLFVYCFCDVSGWKFHNQLRNLLPNSKSLKTSWKQIASISTLLTVSIGTFGSQSVFADTLKQIEPTFDEVSTTYSQPVNIPSLRTQLDSIRKEQILEQKTRVQEEEQASLTRAITYPDNYLIARGTITILSQQTKQQYPFGYLRASDNNRALENDKASLYLVAVGKEGPPFAAKRIALSQLSFPYVFEITTDDLLFPYTPQAYAKSVNSQDTVVVSAIFTRDDDLGQIVGNEEFGFGLSEFTTFAGKKVRGLAKLSIDPGLFGTNSKKPLLQEPERQIFQRIGNEIKRREASPSIASSTTTVSL